MKRSIITLIAFFLIAIGTTNAQKIKVGGGLSYGNEINTIGLRADGVYAINQDFSAAATATYYFEKNNLSWFVVDANAHYNFLKENDMTVYGLAGLNMTFWSWDLPQVFGVDVSGSGSETGINIGAGARKKMGNKLELFGEVKYVLSGAEFFSIGAGILIPIN